MLFRSVNHRACGAFNELRDKIKIHGKSQYYVYREGYVISKDGKIKEPSIYIFDRYFKKIKGSGHSELGVYQHDNEYQIFLSKESALEYAKKQQDLYFIEKEKKIIEEQEKELLMLNKLAKKHGYKLKKIN